MASKSRRLVIMVAALFFALSLAPVWRVGAVADVDPLFQDLYSRYQGLRVLGNPVGSLTEIEGFPAQYFEKGRIEDHRSETTNPTWAFLYGRLVPEMMERNPNGAVSTTSKTYLDLRAMNEPSGRWAVPFGYRQGVPLSTKEGIFVPYDPQLRAVPGYKVPDFFWSYINRADLFPGGWLHDVGLPMTEAFPAKVVKNGREREIIMQAFERTVLSYDGENPPQWRIERGNIGADALPFHRGTRNAIEIPAANGRVALPLHIMARLGKPGERVEARLRWPTGMVLTDTFTLLRGENGNGLLIEDLDWENEGAPPQPPTMPALLEIRSTGGALLARKQIVPLHYDDPSLVLTTQYWTDEERLEPVRRPVPRTESLARAALEELLWGPGPRNLNFTGFGTAIPTPKEVLAYTGRDPSWGPRVLLRKLTIENGIARADFSKELRAYGGGSLRVTLIRGQITSTLKSFANVREVVISIEGQTEGILQP